MTTRLYENSIFKEHVTPPGHPERVDRLRALEKALADPIFDPLDRLEAPRAEDSAVLLAHPESFLDKIRAAIPESGMKQIDGDTHASPKSFEAALHGIGGAMAAVDAVFAKECQNAFVASRPPGHHAEKTTAMGFCLFNNAAIAARHAQKVHGAERVAVVDFDVHHGNGTQDIFWDDATVLYASTHQMPLYPGSGALSETGEHGTICNAPLAPGDGSSPFREAFSTRVLPALFDFQPDLLIISAGFDAHWRDPLANIDLDDDDFDWATGKLMDVAHRHCADRVVSLLEGGYDLKGLASAGSAHIKRLMQG